MSYKLYKHKTKSNSWLVVRSPQDVKPDYFPVYDVTHIEDGNTRYVEI